MLLKAKTHSHEVHPKSKVEAVINAYLADRVSQEFAVTHLKAEYKKYVLWDTILHIAGS